MRRRRVTPAPAALAACLVLAACGAQGAGPGGPAAPSAPPVRTSAGPSGPSGSPGAERAEAAMVEQARRKGQGPDGSGVSRVASPRAAAFLWETAGDRLCLGESALDGGMTSFKCVRAVTAGPRDSPAASLLFGPGALGGGGRVVLAAPPGGEVVLVSHGGARAETTFVRTLSSGWSGRRLYYVVLPALPRGPLDVTVRSGGKERVQSLPTTG
ncbi:hypothetical protein [Streptomyces termitum]|uniref:hypothetical protein n=1 Tax=Streptomyces termitum TaxID=67368 RepID=UPI001678D69C|nr:hypothetical protein [Streptomyces termitum]